MDIGAGYNRIVRFLEHFLVAFGERCGKDVKSVVAGISLTSMFPTRRGVVLCPQNIRIG